MDFDLYLFIQTTPSLIYASIAIFVVALLGGAHCGGMCGPLNVAFIHNTNDFFMYHIGRGLTYQFLSFSLLSLGQILPQFINPLGALTVIVVVILVLQWIPYYKLYKFLPQTLMFKSLTAGIVNGFLPCGFLYGVLFLASSFIDFSWSFFLMFSFWVGTLPIFIFVKKFHYFINFKFGKLFSLLLALLSIMNFYFHAEQKINHNKPNAFFCK